ncbi:MAG: L,D-transpeptidase family protein [Anaerolineae bacterium]|jgi:lipoprotein-anchoring transpeptidase ErfK/SrfK|nr:L,D-transpeptidase family protein [Anaerolineae bacterium]
METQRKPRRARERRAAREQTRTLPMAVPHGEDRELVPDPKPMTSRPRRLSIDRERWQGQGVLIVQDALWYIRHKPIVRQVIGGMIAVWVLLFLASHLLNGRIFPSLYVLGVNIGGLTVDEAEAALLEAWNQEIRIQLIAQGEAQNSIAPSALGLSLAAREAAETAKNLGLSGLPFGYHIQPMITLDYAIAQSYFLNLTSQVNTLPQNASFELRDGIVYGVRGNSGRELDITGTIEYLNDHTYDVLLFRRLDLLTHALPPDVIDPAPYLTDVQIMANQQFALIGYDPFTNETTAWSTRPDVFVSWLEADLGGLAIRDQAFAPFIEALNGQLQEQDSLRFISADEAAEQLEIALESQTPQAYLRVRYRPSTYQVQRGDTAYLIARRLGVPFLLLQEANSGRDLGTLFPGDTVNLPSPDSVVPEMPVATKRIIVDLDRQLLVAFENGQEVFRWAISSGKEEAPTSPGVYQILSQDELAYGSSYTLCSDFACGQWKMYWFMGIYEVSPGLMNGFHGAVELPNGAYLGGGNVGEPYTFGCVMSENGNAEKLYQWAEIGTIVEIISSEYDPRSQLARQVRSA